ncbi:MAG: sugar ABC transporter permease [Treponema sp.]|nr:sugar ABC transporter permease [Treponema sp.]
MRKITIRDTDHEAKGSISTVSRVIKMKNAVLSNLGGFVRNSVKTALNGLMSFFSAFVHRFKNGNMATRASHIIMGFGNFYHKQIIKGFIYLLFQAGFILFMVLCPQINDTPLGYKALINFTTLGTEAGDIFTKADDSMLMLLFGVVTMGIIALFFLLYLSNLKSAYKAECDKQKKGRASGFREDIRELFDNRFHITLLTPSFVGVAFFTIMPTIFMIFIAFTNFDSAHQGEVLFDWVGFANVKTLLTKTGEIGQRFIPVLSWTLVWAVFSTFTCYFGGIFLGILINRKGVRYKTLFRTIFILTIAMPQFVSLLAIRNILGELGPFNTLLVNTGILSEPVSFLANSDSILRARITIIAANFWIGVPYTMLMTSGILLNIPADLYEAARIDGAGPLKCLVKITMPYILFVTTPYLISSFIGNFNNFNVIYLLTEGRPAAVGGYKAGATDLLVTWLFKLSVNEREYNLGSLIGIMTFLCTSTITLLTYRHSKAYKEEDAFQ